MRKLFILLSFLIPLTQCSIYQLSFDGFYQNTVVETVFEVTSPLEEIYADTLPVRITIAHPNGIASIKAVGDGGAYSETFDYNGAPPTITFFKDIAVKYSDTYTFKDGVYNIDFEVTPSEGDPFITNVEFTIHRTSVDDLDFDYDSEHRKEGVNWSYTDKELTFNYSTSGADIQEIILPANFESSPRNIIIDNITENSSISIVHNGNTKSISIPMTTVLPDSYYKDVDRKSPLYGDIEIVTTGGVISTHEIVFYVPNLLILSFDDFSVTDEFTVNFMVACSDHTKLIITYPSGEIVTINDISSLKNGDNYSFTFDENDHLQYNDEYSHTDGIFPLIIDLYDPDNPKPVYTAKTNITIFRKTMDLKKDDDGTLPVIEYPSMLPLSDWANEDTLNISVADTGDTFNTVSISPTITYGVDTTETSDVQFEGFDSHSYSLPVKYFIPNIPDRGTDVSGSISVISKHLHDTQTDNDVFISRWYTNETDFYVSLPKDNPYSFRDLPDVIKNTPPNSGAMWYPITVSSYLYADFSRPSDNIISFNFYYNPNDTSNEGSDSGSATSGDAPISVPLHDGNNTVYNSDALNSKTSSSAITYKSDSPLLENLYDPDASSFADVTKTFYIQTLANHSSENINTRLHLNINDFDLDKYNSTYDPDFGDMEISSTYDLPSVVTEDYLLLGSYGFVEVGNNSNDDSSLSTVWFPLVLNTTTVSGTSSDGEPTSTTHNSLFYHYSHKDSFQLLLCGENSSTVMPIAGKYDGSELYSDNKVQINSNSEYSKNLTYYIEITPKETSFINLRVVVKDYENDPTFIPMSIPAFYPAYTNTFKYISYDSDYDFSSLNIYIKDAQDTSGDDIWVPISIDSDIFEGYGSDLTYFCLVDANGVPLTTVYNEYGIKISNARISRFSDEIKTVYIYTQADKDLDISIKIPRDNIHDDLWNTLDEKEKVNTHLIFQERTITTLTTSAYNHPSTKTETYIQTPENAMNTLLYHTVDGVTSHIWTEANNDQYMWMPITIKDSLYLDYSHIVYFQIIDESGKVVKMRAEQDNTTEYTYFRMNSDSLALNASLTGSSYVYKDDGKFTVYVYVRSGTTTTDNDGVSGYTTKIRLEPLYHSFPEFASTSVVVPVSIGNLMGADSSSDSTVGSGSTFKTPSNEGSMWVKMDINQNNFASFREWNIVPMSSTDGVLGGNLTSLTSDLLYTFYTHHGYIRNRGGYSDTYDYDTTTYNLTEMPSTYYYNYYFYKQFNQSYYIQVPVPDADSNGDKNVTVYSQGYYTSASTANCEYVSMTLNLKNYSVAKTEDYITSTDNYAYNISKIPVGFLYGNDNYNDKRWVEVDLNKPRANGNIHFLVDFEGSDKYIKEVLVEYGSTPGTISPLVYDGSTIHNTYNITDSSSKNVLVGLPMGEHNVFAVINNNTQKKTIVPQTTAQDYDISISTKFSAISQTDANITITSGYNHDNVVFFYKSGDDYIRIHNGTKNIKAGDNTLTIPINVTYEIYFMSVDGIQSGNSAGNVVTATDLFDFVRVGEITTGASDSSGLDMLTSSYVSLNNTYPENLFRSDSSTVFLPLTIKGKLYSDTEGTSKDYFGLYEDYSSQSLSLYDVSGTVRDNSDRKDLYVFLSELAYEDSSSTPSVYIPQDLHINITPSVNSKSIDIGIKFDDNNSLIFHTFDYSHLFTEYYFDITTEFTVPSALSIDDDYEWVQLTLSANLSESSSDLETDLETSIGKNMGIVVDKNDISKRIWPDIQNAVDVNYTLYTEGGGHPTSLGSRTAGNKIYVKVPKNTSSTLKLKLDYNSSADSIVLVPAYVTAYDKNTTTYVEVGDLSDVIVDDDYIWYPIIISGDLNSNYDSDYTYSIYSGDSVLPIKTAANNSSVYTFSASASDTTIYVRVPSGTKDIDIYLHNIDSNFNFTGTVTISDIYITSDYIELETYRNDLQYNSGDYIWHPVSISGLDSDKTYNLLLSDNRVVGGTISDSDLSFSLNDQTAEQLCSVKYILVNKKSDTTIHISHYVDDSSSSIAYKSMTVPQVYLTENYITYDTSKSYTEADYIWVSISVNSDLHNDSSGEYSIYSSDKLPIKDSNKITISSSSFTSSTSTTQLYLGIPLNTTDINVHLRHSDGTTLIPMKIDLSETKFTYKHIEQGDMDTAFTYEDDLYYPVTVSGLTGSGNIYSIYDSSGNQLKLADDTSTFDSFNSTKNKLYILLPRTTSKTIIYLSDGDDYISMMVDLSQYTKTADYIALGKYDSSAPSHSNSDYMWYPITVSDTGPLSFNLMDGSSVLFLRSANSSTETTIVNPTAKYMSIPINTEMKIYLRYSEEITYIPMRMPAYDPTLIELYDFAGYYGSGSFYEPKTGQVFTIYNYDDSIGLPTDREFIVDKATSFGIDYTIHYNSHDGFKWYKMKFLDSNYFYMKHDYLVYDASYKTYRSYTSGGQVSSIHDYYILLPVDKSLEITLYSMSRYDYVFHGNRYSRMKDELYQTPSVNTTQWRGD